MKAEYKRLVRWVRRMSAGGESASQTRFGVMRLDAGDFIQSRILSDGAYEPRTVDLIERLLGEGDCFVDVGANIGQFSLLAAKKVGAAGKVVAIEPNPQTCAELLWNRRANRLERVIEVVHLAVSETPGLVYFETPPAANLGGSRQLRADADASVERYVVASASMVQIVDRLGLQKIDVMKIDVEGAEPSVLASVFALPAALWPRNLVFEFLPGLARDGGSPERLLTQLRARGYAVTTISGSPFVMGSPLPEDNLWARLEGAVPATGG